jgi:hypothetical protein
MIGLFKNLIPVAPLVDSGSPGNRSPQRLAGVGAAETQTSRKLKPGHLHLLLVGSAGVRVRFSANGALGAGAVDATRDVVYGPWSVVPFVPEEGADPTFGSTFVYAEAADGAATYELFVVTLQG